MSDAGSSDASTETSVVNEGGIAEGGGDAGTDGSIGPCNGVVCNGACLTASDCQSCTGAPLLCSGRCVTDCATCVDSQNRAMPIDCFACDVNHENPIGSCAYNDTTLYCLSGSYLGSYTGGAAGYHCACGDGGASDCPGKTQVCAPTPAGSTFCVTCGEVYVYDLDGSACKGGGSCAPASASCQ